MAAAKDITLLSASASTENGSFYVSGALTPYDVENLYEQFATLRRSDGRDVRVEVELGSGAASSIDLRSFTRRMKRLERHGVTVRLHAARGRKRGATPSR